MKKIMILLLFIACLMISGCKSYDYHDIGIEDKVWNFACNIITNPNKIYDLQKNYPEFFNDNYLNVRMKDTAYQKSLCDFIKSNGLGHKLSNCKIVPHGFTYLSVEDYAKKMHYQNLKIDQLYGFVMEFSGNDIGFDFIKIDDHYYLNSIYMPVIWRDN